MVTVIVVMGVSGSGKTTVGRLLAESIEAAFVDADDFHSEKNKRRMGNGIALSEADRGPWLETLRGIVDEALTGGRRLVLACSALSGKSRRRLGTERAGIELVFLDGPRELILSRMRERRHFMPPALLESQLETLEAPAVAIRPDIRLPPEQIVREIRRILSARAGP
jgi:gluconokinase